MAMTMLVIVSMLLLLLLLLLSMSSVHAKCCFDTHNEHCNPIESPNPTEGEPVGQVCADCTYGNPYCGVGKCNVFGCNCQGGCRTEDMIKVKGVYPVLVLPPSWLHPKILKEYPNPESDPDNQTILPLSIAQNTTTTNNNNNTTPNNNNSTTTAPESKQSSSRS